jgi:hypothetical protein
MKSLLATVSLFCFSVLYFYGQNETVYKFLNLPNSAEVAALGGTNISLQNQDVNLIYQNPALLSGSVNKNIGINYINYISDIGYGSLVYAQDIDSVSHWAASLNYLSYGSFDGYTEEEIPTNTFSAGDVCLNLTYSRRLAKNIMAGISLKPVYSYIEDYNSFGLAVDVGANYYNPENDFSVGLVAKNIGVQFTGYHSGGGFQHRESMPWDIQIGVTKRLAHAPFRFSLTYVNLNRWDLNYYKEISQNNNSFTTNNDHKKISWGDMLFRHLIIGAEFIPSKNFNIAVAYNHRRGREFILEDTRSINGFSFGIGLKVYKFSLGAAYAQYAASGNTVSLSLATSLDSFKRPVTDRSQKSSKQANVKKDENNSSKQKRQEQEVQKETQQPSQKQKRQLQQTLQKREPQPPSQRKNTRIL